jgi:hypothetical protein
MKALYIIACCMFLAAIACQLKALGHAGHSTTVLAEAASLDESGRAMARQQADASLRIATTYSLAGVVTAGLGIALWAGSRIRGRRATGRLTPVCPLVLLIAYVMLSLVMV